MILRGRSDQTVKWKAKGHLVLCVSSLGIYGVFDPGASKEDLAATIDEMSSILSSIAGYSYDNIVAPPLGVGRAYSQVTTHDSQPIWNEEHTKFAVMAGRIFDYEARKSELLRRGHTFNRSDSDAEFVLHAFEEWGDKLLDQLNGVFTFAVYDAQPRRLTVVNDRYGMEPFYYQYSKRRFTFASQIKAIIQDSKVKREINWDGWREFFTYGYVLGTKTLFKGIHTIPNASILQVTERRISLKNYWSYARIKVDHESPEEYFVSEGARLIRQAIERQSRNVKECIVLLSGGYDSRCIAAAIKHFTNTSFQTFTTASPVAGDVDPILAQQIAESIGVKNTYVPIPSDLYRRYFIRKVFLVDAMCTEHLWLMPLVESLGDCKINFDGLGGDTLLGPLFLNEENLRITDDLEKLTFVLRKDMARFRVEMITDFFDSPIREELQPRTEDSLLAELKRIGKNENVITIFFMTNRKRNAVSFSPNSIIATKAECLFPFLDRDLVEFGLTIPPMTKLTKGIYYRMLQKLFPDVARIPSPASLTKKKREELASRWKNQRAEPSSSASGPSEIKYLASLLDSLVVPPFLNVDKIKQRTRRFLSDGKDPLPFLVPIIEFCIWYNVFYLKEPIDIS